MKPDSGREKVYQYTRALGKAGLECAKEFSATTHLYTSKTVEKNDFRLFEKGYQLSNRIFDDDIS